MTHKWVQIKKGKKNREQKWYGQENQVPLSCFAPPPYAYLVFPEKEKRLVSCLKSKSHCGETLSEVAFFFYAFCVFTDGPFMTSGFRVGR